MLTGRRSLVERAAHRTLSTDGKEARARSRVTLVRWWEGLLEGMPERGVKVKGETFCLLREKHLKATSSTKRL